MLARKIELNYTVCKWHNGEFYYNSTHMHELRHPSNVWFGSFFSGRFCLRSWPFVDDMKGQELAFAMVSLALPRAIVSECRKKTKRSWRETGKPDTIFRLNVSQHVKIRYDIIVGLNSSVVSRLPFTINSLPISSIILPNSFNSYLTIRLFFSPMRKELWKAH